MCPSLLKLISVERLCLGGAKLHFFIIGWEESYVMEKICELGEDRKGGQQPECGARGFNAAVNVDEPMHLLLLSLSPWLLKP